MLCRCSKVTEQFWGAACPKLKNSVVVVLLLVGVCNRVEPVEGGAEELEVLWSHRNVVKRRLEVELGQLCVSATFSYAGDDFIKRQVLDAEFLLVDEVIYGTAWFP